MIDNTIIQSFVWHDGKRYFVSTIERDSSAFLCSERYNETIVWEWTNQCDGRGKMLLQESDSLNSIEKHIDICTSIYKNGIEDTEFD
jgi:hypothetical protein